MSLTEIKTGLSPGDVKLLRSGNNKIFQVVLIFVIFAFAVSVCSVLLSETYCVFAAVAVIIIVPFIVFVLISRIFASDDLKKGYKIVYSGQISDKIIKTYQNQTGVYSENITEPATHTYMYFILDQREFLVSQEYFDKFQKGQTVEIHQTASGVFMYVKSAENYSGI